MQTPSQILSKLSSGAAKGSSFVLKKYVDHSGKETDTLQAAAVNFVTSQLDCNASSVCIGFNLASARITAVEVGQTSAMSVPGTVAGFISGLIALLSLVNKHVIQKCYERHYQATDVSLEA